MSAVEHLMTVSGPPFFAVSAEPKDVSNEARGWQDSALVVRAIRGRKARTLEALFDEFAAAFQFPYYFGENWAAFRDCITDLDWLPFRPGVVVVIYGAEQVLQDAHPGYVAVIRCRGVRRGCRGWRVVGSPASALPRCLAGRNRR